MVTGGMVIMHRFVFLNPRKVKKRSKVFITNYYKSFFFMLLILQVSKLKIMKEIARSSYFS